MNNTVYIPIAPAYADKVMQGSDDERTEFLCRVKLGLIGHSSREQAVSQGDSQFHGSYQLAKVTFIRTTAYEHKFPTGGLISLPLRVELDAAITFYLVERSTRQPSFF